MANAVDIANELVEHERAAALATHLESVRKRERIDESMHPHVPGQPLACLDCGCQIDPRRLQTLPLTNRCTECAEVAEKLYREKAWMPR
jgi:RNA polymerase-binding transcription factor DksA